VLPGTGAAVGSGVGVATGTTVPPPVAGGVGVLVGAAGSPLPLRQVPPHATTSALVLLAERMPNHDPLLMPAEADVLVPSPARSALMGLSN
jgi:hypothetical protein